MNIQYTKQFIKAYDKLRDNEKDRVIEAIELFCKDPFAKKLRNHQLRGKLAQYRSISAGGDIRLHFKEENGYVTVVFIQIGTHSNLY